MSPVIWLKMACSAIYRHELDSNSSKKCGIMIVLVQITVLWAFNLVFSSVISLCLAFSKLFQWLTFYFNGNTISQAFD